MDKTNRKYIIVPTKDINTLIKSKCAEKENYYRRSLDGNFTLLKFLLVPQLTTSLDHVHTDIPDILKKYQTYSHLEILKKMNEKEWYLPIDDGIH